MIFYVWCNFRVIIKVEDAANEKWVNAHGYAIWTPMDMVNIFFLMFI